LQQAAAFYDALGRRVVAGNLVKNAIDCRALAWRWKGSDIMRWDDRDGLLEAVRWLRNEMEWAVAAAGDEPGGDAGGGDAWARKDLIAHLTGWQRTTVARLEAGLRGEKPVMPWPAGLDEEEDVDEINRWFFETSRDKPLAEIQRESRETFDRLERAIAALPEGDLLQPDRVPWMAGAALGPVVVRGAIEHYQEEHGPDFRAWREGV
jgi:hypothetical protein